MEMFIESSIPNTRTLLILCLKNLFFSFNLVENALVPLNLK